VERTPISGLSPSRFGPRSYAPPLVSTDIDAAERQFALKFRTLFETMGQGFVLIEFVRDRHGRAVDQRYIQINPAFEQLLGVPVAEAQGRLASEVFPGLDPWFTQTFERIVRSGQPERVEHLFAITGRWFEMHVYPVSPERFIVLYDDITERKHDEATLRETLDETQAELRALSLHLLDAQEEERLRVARDLHDSVGQRAALIGLEAGHLERMVESLPREAVPVLTRMRAHIAALSTEIRDVSSALHPTMLEDLGLPAAALALVDEHCRAGSNITLHQEQCPPIPLHIATALYRIAQEALSNAAKHAPGCLSVSSSGIESRMIVWCYAYTTTGPVSI